MKKKTVRWVFILSEKEKEMSNETEEIVQAIKWSKNLLAAISIGRFEI